jgi:rhomboid family GlyGly-CTERM serine protease
MKYSYLYQQKKYHLLVFFLFIALMAIGQQFTDSFQYDRLSIANGEYWRIITCHFCHIGWKHLLLNLIGFIFIILFFFHIYPLVKWFYATIFCSVFIGLGFLILMPELDWYMGLSGLLHSFLVIGLVGEIKRGRKLYYVGLLVVLLKVVMEKYVGPSIYTRQFLEFTVIADAHVLGALSGLMFSFLSKVKK